MVRNDYFPNVNHLLNLTIIIISHPKLVQTQFKAQSIFTQPYYFDLSGLNVDHPYNLIFMFFKIQEWIFSHHL